MAAREVPRCARGRAGADCGTSDVVQVRGGETEGGEGIKEEARCAMSRTFLVVGSWLLCSVAAAQTWKQEPTSYRGVAFGATFEEAKEKVDDLTGCDRYGAPNATCKTKNFIPGVGEVSEWWLFSAKNFIPGVGEVRGQTSDGRLVYVSFNF